MPEPEMEIKSVVLTDLKGKPVPDNTVPKLPPEFETETYWVEVRGEYLPVTRTGRLYIYTDRSQLRMQIESGDSTDYIKFYFDVEHTTVTGTYYFRFCSDEHMTICYNTTPDVNDLGHIVIVRPNVEKIEKVKTS